MNIFWFSCGASSAVMTKLCLNETDKIYYCQTNSENPVSWDKMVELWTKLGWGKIGRSAIRERYNKLKQ